jgi:hypothetical protein
LENITDIQLPYTIKAERHTYLIFLFMIGPIITLSLIGTLFRASIWPVPVIMTILLGSIWLVIKSFTICLLDDKIIVTSLFRRHEIRYQEISRFNFGYKKTNRGAVPAIIIVQKNIKKPFSFPIKPFSKKDLAIVGNVMQMKAPSAFGDWPFS